MASLAVESKLEAVPRTEEVEQCPVCLGRQIEFLFWTFDRLYRLPGRFGESRCADCGLVFVTPRPVEEALGYYYPEEYAPHQPPAYTLGGNDTGGLVSKLRTGIRQSVLDELGYQGGKIAFWQRAGRPFFNNVFFSQATYGWGDRFPRFVKDGRALDIGCGNGTFLSYLKHHGWEVQGVDMSRQAANVAKEYFDIDVFVGGLAEAPFSDQCFDYINMSHVLEHVREPRQTIEEVRRLLKDDGILYIEVPNYESFGCESGGEFWFALDAPRHLLSFSPNSLGTLLSLCGFRIVRMTSKVADLFAWDETLRKEEKAGKLLSERPDNSALTATRLAFLKGRARLGRMLRPLSGDYLCCWAQRS